MSAEKVMRVGFVSTANIATKNYIAASAAPGVRVTAVSSRSLDRAQAWASTRDGVEKAYGSHEELFADPDIDAVYIPAPTGVRLPLVLAAARAGKSVLTEKPIAPTAIEAAKMVEACRQAGVVFMDGIMFMHNERLSMIRAAMDDPAFGDLRRVVSDFGFRGDDAFHKDNIRVHKDLEPLGSLGDLGVYNIRLAMFGYGWQLPQWVSAVYHTQRDGVPIEISSTLHFGPGKSSTFTNSFETQFRQHAAFVGQNQSIEVSDFTLSGTTPDECSFDLIKQHGLTKHDLLVQREAATVTVSMAHTQETSMWIKFAELHHQRLTPQGKSDMLWWADLALNTQKVLDALMTSAGQDGKCVYL